MALDLVPTGKNVPHEVNVIIEIPKDADPVKYEVDKATGAIFVDRILSTPMRYPCNYGYVPHTLCGDGDPADVLVILPLPLVPGSVIRCRPVGVLMMQDEAGSDEKLLAVPVDKVFNGYSHVQDIAQVSKHWLERIGHFFETTDILITPSLATPPVPLGTLSTQTLTLDQFQQAMAAYCPFTGAFNATGQPAMSLPLHWSSTGLPVGVQLVAGFGADALLLQLAAQLEQAIPWFQRTPPL